MSSNSAGTKRGGEWTKCLSDKKLSKREKCERIKEKAKEIEEMAIRKEQILSVKGGGERKPNSAAVGSREEKEVDEVLEVNDMLIDAIKAKLAILDRIS